MNSSDSFRVESENPTKVRDEGAQGGGERGQTVTSVKYGSFCFADADTDMSEVSSASGQRKN